MSNDLPHLDELDRQMSTLRHPSGNRDEKVLEASKWFNSLKPAEKSDVFLSLLGKVVRDDLS